MAEARRYAIAPQLDIEQILKEAQQRWLRPAEICEILKNYRNFHIAPEPPNTPPSGSLFLFDHKVLRYFWKDGHNWRKKKDGKTVKEAHERLISGSIDVLHCYHAHGEGNENFQRRSYWMLKEEFMHIVLVHYLEVKIGSSMDVDDNYVIENNENHSNEDEMHGIEEGVGGNSSSGHMVEEHVPAEPTPDEPIDPTASEVNTIVQQVGRGKKKKSMNRDNRAVKQRLLTLASPPLNKGKGVAIIPKCKVSKSNSTPTSKFMASAFKAAASNKSMELVPKLAKVVPDASASASGSGSIATSVPKSIAVEDDEEGDEQQVGKKQGKKRTSWVWEHFTRYDVEVQQSDGSIVKEEWAKCKKCAHKAKADSSNGTKAFSNHLTLRHHILKGQQYLAQDGDTIETYKYDENFSLRLLYYAIIMHEYPFSIAQHKYFVKFIRSLRPSFPLKSRVTIRKEIMDLYVEEKNMLYAQFKNLSCRVSFTMDTWTSIQNKSYLCVTAHWIDDNWNMQKRIINFLHVEGSHGGIKLSDTFFANVLNWNLDKKMFALSLDNAAANKVAIDIVIDNAKDLLVCGGKFFHVRCANHILNLVAKDGLAVIAHAIGNIREFITIIKRSPPQYEAFEKCAKECDLDTKKALSLDVATRWNSTYIMVRDAIYYKNAFDRLAKKEKEIFGHINPSATDWLNALNISKCLKKFYDVTLLFSGTSYPTANHFFRKFSEIKMAIARWCDSNDPIICCMAYSMRDKFDKYWKMNNMALAVGAFLDPRYKHRVVELYMSKMYDSEMAELEKVAFMNVINELFACYSSATDAKSISNSKGTSSKSKDFVPNQHVLMDDEDEDEVDLDELYAATNNEKKMSELDLYMSEGLVKANEADVAFDVLSWWKGQVTNFPILSTLARDVLSMQVSTVASESAFSSSGRIVDAFRSRLKPEIIEALVCTKDWKIASEKDLECEIKTISEAMAGLDLDDDVVT